MSSCPAAEGGVSPRLALAAPGTPLLTPGGIFTVRSGLAAGMTTPELLAPCLHRPLRGVRSYSAVTDLRDRCRAVLAIAPPGTVISHLTAARLHELWLPPRDAEPEPETPVDIIRPHKTSRVRRPQVNDHQGLGGRQLVDIGGLPVTAPADTWADLHGLLILANLVAVADGIAAEQGLANLRAAFAWRAKARAHGVITLRHALARVRTGSASRLESIGRWVMVNGGLPEPELNVDILNDRGEWLAKADYVWRAQRVCAEAQSKEHHDGKEHIDEARRQLLVDDGWCVAFLYAETVFVKAKAQAFVDHLHHQLQARAPS